MSIQGLKISKEQIRYVFPKKINTIKQFLHIKNVKDNLKQQFKQFAEILPNFPYRSKYPSNGMGLTLQCSFCPNKLVYEINKKKGKFQLKTFCVDHIHGLNFDNQQIRKQQPIQSYPIYVQNIQKLIRQKIQSLQQPLSSHFQTKQTPKMKQPHNFQELLKSLGQQNYYVVYQPQNFKEQKLTYPDFLFVTSPDMRKMYYDHGRSIGFDFTYSLIRQTPMTMYGKRQYIIGLIAGLNSYRRIGIFALVVASQESTHFVERAFTQFIKYMNKQPESIVTDQAPGMLAAMKNIKQKGVYNGETFWDTFHVLKTYKFRNKVLKNHMRFMIRQKCKYQFHKMYLQAVRMARTQQQMDAIHKFMHESSKYCISQIPTTFIGLGVSDSHNQMVNNLIKNQIPLQAKFFKVVYKIIMFIDQRNLMAQTMNRQTCRVDEVVNSRQLHIVRYSLCRTVYSFFFVQLGKCCKVDLIYRDTDTNDFYSIQDANTVHYITKLPIQQCPNLIKNSRVTHIRDAFKCTCSFLEKTGIPCEHILKVIIQTDNNFIDRLDQYWVVEQPDKLYKCVANIRQQVDKKIKKRGRPFGKPTLFYRPNDDSEMRLPKGVSTFEPIKPRGFNQAYPENNPEMVLPKKIDQSDEQQEKPQSFEKQIKNRKQMMKQFFSEKGRR